MGRFVIAVIMFSTAFGLTAEAADYVKGAGAKMLDIPRPEHPRPDFMRQAWQNLNGKWQFAVDNEKSGIEKAGIRAMTSHAKLLCRSAPKVGFLGLA